MAVLFFAFGLAFGSFLNVCIYRVPLALEEQPESPSAIREMLYSIAAWRSVAVPERSFCPACGHPVRWYDNLPVLSWFVLGGRCRDCRSPISFRYVTVEFLVALLFLACYARFGLTLVALKYAIFTLLIVALIFTDAAHRLLPDAYTIPGLLLGLIFSLLVPVDQPLSQIMPSRLLANWRLLSLADAVLAGIVGAGFLFGAGLLYRRARGREGMGMGDIKLMAMIGAFLGLRLTVLTIFGASVLGTVFAMILVFAVWFKRLRRRMIHRGESFATAGGRAWNSAKLVRYYAVPFGVFLGASALLATFFGGALVHWYLAKFL